MASNLEEATKYKNLGNQSFQAGRFEEAVEFFTKAIELNPNDHVFFSNRSGAHASLYQYEEALADAEKCVNLKPDWAKGYQRKGLAEFYLEMYDEAVNTYNAGLALDPNNTALKEGLVRVKEEMDKPQAGPGGPGGPGGMPDMSVLLGKLMTNPKTAGYMKDPEFVKKLQSIQTNPQNLGMYLSDPKIMEAFQVMFGDMMGKEGPGGPGGPGAGPKSGSSGEHEHGPGCSHEHEHEHEHEEFIPKKTAPPKKEESPKKEQQFLDESDEYRQKGNQAYKVRNFEEALSFYDKALALKPTEILLYSNKAAVYLELKNYEQALEECEKALKVIDETSGISFEKKAKIYARKGAVLAKLFRYDESIKFYEKSLLEDNTARVKDELKQVQKLKKDMEDLAYVNPELAEKHNETAKELFLAGKYPEAMKEYNECIKRNPKDPKFFSNRATCYIKLLEFSRALYDLEKCLELDPKFIKGYIKKANCHVFLKEYHKAMSMYEAGLKLDPNNDECKQGIQEMQMKIFSGNETKAEQEERANHAMADPEIQMILKDPQMMNLLRNMQENPNNADNLKAMKDPTIAGKISKLIASGILKVG